MEKFRRSLALVVLTCSLACAAAAADDPTVLPKYGSGQKTEAQLAADAALLAAVDRMYGGDRNKAAQSAVAHGWHAFRAGRYAQAMRRFNQAWLIDASNGQAYWGMGAVRGASGKSQEALLLLQEAAPLVGDDIDFEVDFARALGLAGVESGNEVFVRDAFSRFESIHQRAPENMSNLHNWAILLFARGDYAEAWSRIKLVERTPRGNQVDPAFIAALQARMARP